MTTVSPSPKKWLGRSLIRYRFRQLLKGEWCQMPFRVVILFLCEISKRKHPMDAIPHSLAWNVAPKKEKKTFQPESANPQLWREIESRPNLKMIKNHVFDNAQYWSTFFVEISATKGDRDLVLFSLIKIDAPKKEKKIRNQIFKS